MSLRHLVYHNFWLKLFSLVLASLIYLVIPGSDLHRDLVPALTTPGTLEYRVPVTVIKRPGDARVFKVSPDHVVITVTGELAVLRELSNRDLLAQVDMTDPRQTPDLNHVVRTHVPSGLAVTDVTPRAVTVERISP